MRGIVAATLLTVLLAGISWSDVHQVVRGVLQQVDDVNEFPDDECSGR